MKWRPLLYDKLELLSITLRNKVLTQKQIESFINSFIDNIKHKIKLSSLDRKNIRKQVFRYLNRNYNRIFIKEEIYYFHKNSDINQYLSLHFKCMFLNKK